MLVVIDLEATTSDDASLPRDEMETIEFGAILVDLDSLLARDEFQSFVAPVRHPTLTAFCTELTGITQAMLEGAPSFPEAMAALQAKLFAPARERGDEVIWGSWGLFDDTQLRRDCQHHGLTYPMPRHVNLKELFGKRNARGRRYGMAQALSICGLTLEGAHHRALDDTRNISRMLPWIFGDARLPAA